MTTSSINRLFLTCVLLITLGTATIGTSHAASCSLDATEYIIPNNQPSFQLIDLMDHKLKQLFDAYKSEIYTDFYVPEYKNEIRNLLDENGYCDGDEELVDTVADEEGDNIRERVNNFFACYIEDGTKLKKLNDYLKTKIGDYYVYCCQYKDYKKENDKLRAGLHEYCTYLERYHGQENVRWEADSYERLQLILSKYVAQRDKFLCSDEYTNYKQSPFMKEIIDSGIKFPYISTGTMVSVYDEKGSVGYPNDKAEASKNRQKERIIYKVLRNIYRDQYPLRGVFSDYPKAGTIYTDKQKIKKRFDKSLKGAQKHKITFKYINYGGIALIPNLVFGCRINKAFCTKSSELLLYNTGGSCLNTIVQELNKNPYIPPCFNLNTDIRNAKSIALIVPATEFYFLLQQILDAQPFSEVDVYVNMLDKTQKDKIKNFTHEWDITTTVNIIGPHNKNWILSEYQKKKYDLVIDTGILGMKGFAPKYSGRKYLFTLTDSLKSKGTLYLYNLAKSGDGRFRGGRWAGIFHPDNYDKYKDGKYMYEVRFDRRPLYVIIRNMEDLL